MNYYKAKEQDTPPYIVFELVATSAEELERLEMTDDPLVVPEERLTNPDHPEYISYEYGVCHLRIQNGELVPAQVEEINQAQADLGKATQAVLTKEAGKTLDEETFVHESKNFPMNAGARELYRAIFDQRPATYTVATLEGDFVITGENIDAIQDAYNQKILDVFKLGE